MAKLVSGVAGALLATLSIVPEAGAQANPPAPSPSAAPSGPASAPAPAPPAPEVTGRVVATAPCAPAPRKLDPLFGQGAFFMRFSIGPGYLWGNGDPNTELTGASVGFNATLGGFILQNFALHADVGWMNTYSPDFTVDGTTLTSTDVIFQASTFRVGASYYFQPIRVYASLSAGFGVAALTAYSWLSDGSVGLIGTEYTKVGPSFAAEIGKEFELSPTWALGLAAHYEFLSVDPGDDHNRVTIGTAQQISLRFLATFGER
jgi:Outer membrane protein beta-barrel domain